jgi:hypothetical protein
MRAGERVGDDREGGPPLAGEQTAGRGQEDPVGSAIARSPPLAVQNAELVAQFRDLQGPMVDARANEQAHQAA